MGCCTQHPTVPLLSDGVCLEVSVAETARRGGPGSQLGTHTQTHTTQGAWGALTPRTGGALREGVYVLVDPSLGFTSWSL